MKEKMKKWIPDRIYLKHRFKSIMGRRLNLKNPKTFNEKLQWLKLYNRNPEYTVMVDKYAAKKYIAERIGGKYIIPTIGVWNSFDEIDFDSLPNQFVLKCTHDSGGLVVCADKSELDIERAKRKIEQSLKQNYYYSGREWPYKHVPHRVIAEQYMADDLWDYSLFGFREAPRMTLVYSERLTKAGLKEVFYDEAWNHLNVPTPAHGHAILPIQRPTQYERMKKLAAEISKQAPFVRMDFYEISAQMYFGVLTLNSSDGLAAFQPETGDFSLGKWTKLPSGAGYRLDSGDCSIIIGSGPNIHAKALVDYKFFCFNGVAESVMVCTERETGHPKFYFFDKDWNLKKYNTRGKEASEGFTLPKPDCIDEMFALAEQLSGGIPYVRVDLYCIDGLVYFGEMTFFPDSGLDANVLPESDAHWGDMLQLPPKRRG